MNSSDEKIVCILGTGFSKAIFQDIPLLVQLENEVYKKILDKSRPGYKEEFDFIYKRYIKSKNIENFEDILTYIYSSIPWKSDDEYHLLKSLYFYISNILVEVFSEKEKDFRIALRENLDQRKDEIQSISDFIYYLHWNRANVITFNYDTIFEIFAINIIGLKDIYQKEFHELGDIHWIEYIDAIYDDSKKYPIDIDIDKENKVLKFYYRNINFPPNFNWGQYYLDNFKDIFTLQYHAPFREAFQSFILPDNNLKIGNKDIYRIPIIRILERGGYHFERFNYYFEEDNQKFLRDSLSLHKLHGSINWFYSPNESGSSPIYLKSGSRATEKIDEYWMQDLKPIIIPPLIDKSSFMSINSLKLTWESARKALSNANKIFIFGYSLPESDLTVRLFLKNFIKENAEINVVDIKRYNSDETIYTDNIEFRLRKLFKIEKEELVDNKKSEEMKVFRFNLERGLKLNCFYPGKLLDKEKIIYKFIDENIKKPKNKLNLLLSL